MAWSPNWNALGLLVSGDCGGNTIYTDRYGRKTWFLQAPPLTPPTPIQQWNHARFRAAAALYRQLSTADKDRLGLCCRRLSLLANRSSLWTSLFCQRDDTLRQTLQRQSGVPLPNPRDVQLTHPTGSPSFGAP